MCNEKGEKEMATPIENTMKDKLDFMDDIKKIISQTMKDKNLSSSDVRKSMGIKRYEK